MVIPNIFTTCHMETQNQSLMSFRSNVHTIDACLITVNFPVSGNFIVFMVSTKRIQDYRVTPIEESSMAPFGYLLFSLFWKFLYLTKR